MKITNTDVKALKIQADEQGITYAKNATAEQMKELLWIKESLQNNEPVNTPIEKNTPKDNVDVNALLNRLNELENLVRKTWDSNKIKDFDREQETLNNFSFSVKLFPTREKDYPIIKWETVTNFIGKDSKEDDQTIEVTYLKEWNEEKEVIKLPQFATFLKRSEKLIAKTIKNLDESDVYISKQLNPETKLEYYIMNPKDQTFNVTLEIDGKEITILSTYLNA